MWVIELLKLIFRFGTSANEVALKAMPSEKIQEEKFELKKETLSEKEVTKIANERNRLADEFFGDLRRHPELSIEDKVNFECPTMRPEDRMLLIKQLTNRLNADEIYSRIKRKKGKFDF